MEIKRNILLNPGPATTTDTVKLAQVVPDICPRENEFCDLMARVRTKLVNVVKGDSRHTAVLFAASGTGGIEAMISSVPPETGELLIINNGAYGERMRQIAEVYFARERILEYKIPSEQYPDVSAIAEILDRRNNITHIGVVHHETTTGMINPAREIAQMAHDRGLEVMVDAVSSYAGIDIDIERDGFDYLVSTSNKNIQGMAGIAFVIAKKEKIKKTAGHPGRSFYFNLAQQHEAFEKTGQMRFTPPVQVLYALEQALDEFFEETLEGRIARYKACRQALKQGLEALGFKTLLPEQYQGHLITSVIEPDAPGYSFQDMHDWLYKKGVTIYPGKVGNIGTFRIANIGAINADDICGFLEELENYMASRKIKLAQRA